MLEDVLKEKRCFKLILGAGNQNYDEIEKLVALYSIAGCTFFDVSADVNAILAAKKGIARSGIKDERYICISVGTSDDIHMKKAEINLNKCANCGKCMEICPQNSIFAFENSYKVDKQKCIGCSKCFNVCKNNAVELKSETKDLKEILPPLIELGIDCIEFHTSGENEDETFAKWNEINSLYGEMLSICMNRAKLSNEKYISLIKKMTEKRKPYSTIIQADGAPMSGGCDDYKTTLQTVAMAEVVQNLNLPLYVILSGGTNSKSTELAKLCGVNINGIGIGSYARKIVKETLGEGDFENSLKIAKNLVNISINNMKEV